MQEFCDKPFAVHILNLANHMKKQDKKHQNASRSSIGEKQKTKSLMFSVSFFHVICKISNFNIVKSRAVACLS